MTAKKLCSIDGCGKPVSGRGWCSAHWWRWKHHGDPLKLRDPIIKPDKCNIDGCENGPTGKRGMCNAHYLRWYRHGDPNVRMRQANGSVDKWIVDHANHEGEECLIWPFARGHDGRGRCGGHISPQAHRAMCIVVHGPPPSETHQAAHSCGKGHEGCVHPRHLRWATPKENCFDQVVHGTQVRGEARHNSILTEQDIPVIRSRSNESASVLGPEYGVDPETIRDVWMGRTWAWLK